MKNPVNLSKDLSYAETTLELLADLEHEFRVPRHSIWLGLAARQHERHLRKARRKSGSTADSLAGCTAHGIDRSTHHRLYERSHVDASRSPPPVLSCRRYSGEHCTLLHADVFESVDGGRITLDP